MKKFILGLAAVLILVSTTAFAGGKENPALTTFQNEFKDATDVKWQEGKDVIKASFNLNDFRVEAFFSYTGELLGTARNIIFNQLPLAVIKEINKRYATAPIHDITEYSTGAETFYTMAVETPTKHLKLKVFSNGNISVEKKIKR